MTVPELVRVLRAEFPAIGCARASANDPCLSERQWSAIARVLIERSDIVIYGLTDAFERLRHVEKNAREYIKKLEADVEHKHAAIERLQELNRDLRYRLHRERAQETTG